MNEKNKIKVSIIGFGRMGITHFSIINSNPLVEVVAVADTSSTITSLLKKYTNVKTYNNYQDLFKNEILDAAIICTPPNLHHPISVLAAENNIHVFLEKPCTLNKDRALDLSNIFQQKGLVNQVGYVNRFNDIFLEVKRLLEKKLIGKIINFRSEMYSGTILKSDSENSWRSSRKSGGGATIDMAAHAIDLVNFLIGKPDKVIGSNLIKIFSTHVEDAINSTFIYSNGVTGTLNVNWSDESYRKPTNKIEIFGNRGKMIANQHGLKIYCKKEDENEKLRKGWNTVYITDVFKPVPFYVRGNEFTSQLYHFIACINDRVNKSSCTFMDASYTLDVIEQIFKDYKANGKI